MLRNIIVGISLVVLTQLALAIQSPVTLLQGVSKNMIAALQKNQTQLQTNPKLVRNIVKKNLLPHVAVMTMSGSVIGQPWRSASSSQKKQFAHVFVNYVVSTYARALQSYTSGDTINFYPLRQNYKTERAVMVRSQIHRTNGQNIAVNYYMLRSNNTWKIYDFSIENVSLVQNYRAQFANTLAQGGMDLLLKKLSTQK